MAYHVGGTSRNCSGQDVGTSGAFGRASRWFFFCPFSVTAQFCAVGRLNPEQPNGRKIALVNTLLDALKTERFRFPRWLRPRWS